MMNRVECRADAPLDWKSLEQYWPRPDRDWRQWLCEPGSLTRKLQRLSGGEFCVQVVGEGWCRPDAIALRPNFSNSLLRQQMWSRQVLLLGRGTPWVAAHTLIPRSSLRGSLRSLKDINNKPLGAFLFRQRQLRRERFEVARSEEGCWGRRSLFFIGRRPVLVAEFFLPSMIEYARQHASGAGMMPPGRPDR